MNSSAQAELTFALTIGLLGGAFVLWGLWHAVWGIYDHYVGLTKRRRNSAFDARVGRDVYRFTKGVHHR
jgi:hypothetical protein